MSYDWVSGQPQNPQKPQQSVPPTQQGQPGWNQAASPQAGFQPNPQMQAAAMPGTQGGPSFFEKLKNFDPKTLTIAAAVLFGVQLLFTFISYFLPFQAYEIKDEGLKSSLNGWGSWTLEVGSKDGNAFLISLFIVPLLILLVIIASLVMAFFRKTFLFSIIAGLFSSGLGLLWSIGFAMANTIEKAIYSAEIDGQSLDDTKFAAINAGQTLLMFISLVVFAACVGYFVLRLRALLQQVPPQVVPNA